MRAVTASPYRALRARWVIALAIACGLVLSQLPGLQAPLSQQQSELEWLADPRPVAAFTLASAQGEVTASALQGHWQLLALGFTHCPDLCPTTLTQLAALRAAIADTPLRVIFVSVDSERDSPARLAAYVHFFGPGITGITGADEQLRHLAHSLGMDFRRDGAGDHPRISHSPTIALIGPDGTLRARLRPGFDVQQAARELAARIRVAS